MQKAETVLSILKQKSKQDESHRYDRIYRNLFNEDFFLRAYQKIHAKQGNMTPGTDGTTIDGFSRKQISQLIELLKWERYQPKPVRRTYIPKKNGKMRPLLTSWYRKQYGRFQRQSTSQFSAIIRTVFGLIEAVTPHCIKLKAPVGEPTG